MKKMMPTICSLLSLLVTTGGCSEVFVDREAARLAKENVLWRTTIEPKENLTVQELNQRVADKYVHYRYVVGSGGRGMLLPRFLHELLAGNKISVEELDKLGFTITKKDLVH